MNNSLQAGINQRTLTFLLVSLGLITFPHVFHVPVPIISFFFFLLIWRFIGVWWPDYLPNKWLVFLLLLSGIGLLFILHQGVFGRDAGTAVFVTALGLKLLEIKSQRDLYLITYLAFVVAASQFLYLQNILMAGYILLVCISLLATLICINSQHLTHFQSLKVAAKILFQALPLVVIIFIFFPRIEAPRWSFLQDSNTAMTGLGDTLEPGSISQLGVSGERVFRAKFSGEIPPPELRYWRGPVFSYTDGKRWKQTQNTYFKNFLDKITFQGEAYQYKILMEPQAKNWVFGLDMPADFKRPLYKNGNHQLLTSMPVNKRAEYTLASYAQYNTGYITKTELVDNLQLPKRPGKRIRDLIAQLSGTDNSPETLINNLFAHFRENDFYYTLKPPLMGDNPIETFLFDARAGFCGHYATAFVYLMRVAGVPARVVSGYQGGEYNEVGGFIEVRQANAHAWAEIWISGKGWVRYDPTTAVAPERILQDVNIDQQIADNAVSFISGQFDSKAFSFFKIARNLWSSADYSWQRWIINYDHKHQLNLLSGLGIDTLKSMVYWLSGLVFLIITVLALILFHRQRPNLDQAQIYYAKACLQLTKMGLVRQNNEGANDFAKRVNARLPQLKESFENITQLYVKIRYGKEPGKLNLQQLKASASAFRVSKEM